MEEVVLNLYSSLRIATTMMVDMMVKGGNRSIRIPMFRDRIVWLAWPTSEVLQRAQD